jgi:hypothetical protein
VTYVKLRAVYRLFSRWLVILVVALCITAVVPPRTVRADFDLPQLNDGDPDQPDSGRSQQDTNPEPGNVPNAQQSSSITSGHRPPPHVSSGAIHQLIAIRFMMEHVVEPIVWSFIPGLN